MSLIINYNDKKFVTLAQSVFDELFRRDKDLETQIEDRTKILIYDDITYNLSHLLTAVHFNDPAILSNYARWLYALVCNHSNGLSKARIMDYLLEQYEIITQSVSELGQEAISGPDKEKALRYLELARKEVAETATDLNESASFLEGEHYELRKLYLNALMSNRTREAFELIRNAYKDGIPLTVIYEEVLAKVMYEIGALWNQDVITVDKEHYATSVTQTIMSAFYDEIFARPKTNLTLISCAVGSELHELGIRMLSDIFEYNGWDTYYLGAALPHTAILDAVEEYRPHLVALSVTMPPYLAACEKIVSALKTTYPDVKIAVGGQAFTRTNDLWEQWDIDYYAPTARDLLTWAEKSFDGKLLREGPWNG